MIADIRVSAVNLTLATLIRDATSVRKLLTDSFKFAPDLIGSLINMEITISASDIMSVKSIPQLQQLFCAKAKYDSKLSVCHTNSLPRCETSRLLIPV